MGENTSAFSVELKSVFFGLSSFSRSLAHWIQQEIFPWHGMGCPEHPLEQEELRNLSTAVLGPSWGRSTWEKKGDNPYHSQTQSTDTIAGLNIPGFPVFLKQTFLKSSAEIMPYAKCQEPYRVNGWGSLDSPVNQGGTRSAISAQPCAWRLPFLRAIISARGSLTACPRSANPCLSCCMADFGAKEGG